MRFDFVPEMLEDGSDGCGHDLAEAADGGEPQRVGKLVNQGEIVRGAVALRPSGEEVNQFLRTHAAGNAFPAGFVAEKLCGVERHVQHARVFAANDDRAGAEHGARFGERFEIEFYTGERRGEIAGRGPRGRKAFQFFPAGDAAGVFVDQIGDRRAHGNFVNAGLGDITADAHEFQARATADALRFVPIHAAHQNRRHVRESFDVVDDGGLFPQAVSDRKRRLVARFGALAFDGFEQGAFFAADVAAGADEQLQFEGQLAAEDAGPDEARFFAAVNFLFENFFLLVVFVANVEDALLRSGQQPRENHSFDYEMRDVG